MHISNIQLNTAISENEKEHYNQCSECQEDHKNLLQLKNESNNLDNISPPDLVWKKIASNRIKYSPVKVKPARRFFMLPIAASIFISLLSWGIWNDLHMKNKLTSALEINKLLEMKLNEVKYSNEKYQGRLIEIRQLERKLQASASIGEQLDILHVRQKLLSQMLKNKKRNNYAFTI